ncbi:MAG: hypothetical protein KDG50_15755 [Chromatiales bacterium]|nr:hypothetical protein [Chromatiales bacterium]
MRKTVAVIAGVLSLSPVALFALGLGDVHTNSALNQPLDAEIDLVSVEPVDFQNLRVNLASDEAFERAGVPRAFLLTSLRFEPAQRADGTYYIHVTTREPVREPVVDFILEADWLKGRLLREYAVFLDPPTVVARAQTPIVTPPKAEPVPARPTAGATAAAPSASVPAPAASSSPDGAAMGVDAYGPTKRNDTLWVIAEQMRRSDYSHAQTMMAIVRANPGAFIGGNANLLKTGRILNAPTESDYVEPGAAQREFARQVAEWRSTREVAAVDSVPGAPVVPEAGAKEMPSTVVTAPESTAPSLKLASAKPGAAEPGPAAQDNAAEGLQEELSQVREKLVLAEERNASAAQENAELGSRVSDLEERIDAMTRLLTFKEEQLALLQQRLAQAQDAEAAAREAAAAAAAKIDSAGMVDTTVADDAQPAMPEMALAEPAAIPEAPTGPASETVAPVEPVMPEPVAESPSAEPVVAPPVVEPPAPTKIVEAPPPEIVSVKKPAEPKLGFMDRAMANPLVVGLVGAFILILVALLYVAWRRRQMGRSDFAVAPAAAAAAAGAAGRAPDLGPASAPSEDTSFLSDFSPSDIDAIQDDTGEVDPLAEADVYLAYGRYQQAEELVSEAIEAHPQRTDLKLKLLEIHFATKDHGAFDALAEELKGKGLDRDTSVWNKVLAWGYELNPKNAMYAAAAGGAAAFGASAVADDVDGASGFGEAGDDDLDAFDSAPVSNYRREPDIDSLTSDSDLLSEESSSHLPDELEGLSELDLNAESELDLDMDLSSAAFSGRSDASTFDSEISDVEDRPSTSRPGSSSVFDDLNLDLDDDTGTEGPGSRGSDEFDSLMAELDDIDDSEISPEMDSADREDDDMLAEQLPDLDLDLDELGEVEPASGLRHDSAPGSKFTDDEMPSSALGFDMGSGMTGHGDDAVPDDDEVSTKLDLARAYMEMGDAEGAKSILLEVVDEGSGRQRDEAQGLLDQL